jgi:ribosomal protein S18 acetylase RimI-like enzyme
MAALSTRPLHTDDHSWVTCLLEEHWGSVRSVSRGQVHRADRLPGFVAEIDGQRVGLVTFEIAGEQCEVVTLNSLREQMGIGTALLDAVREVASDAGCRRLWLITTNDNLAALGFYQKRGWRLVAIHRDALDESRRLKPEIGHVGIDGIPLRDEIELELPL